MIISLRIFMHLWDIQKCKNAYNAQQYTEMQILHLLVYVDETKIYLASF